MPTLPLFTPPDARPAGASPAASHRVVAPGGYEWWHFEAEDPAGGLRLVATLYDGYPFHPAYLRAHARYRRRPTRVAPAVPADYPCVDVALYENGAAVQRRMAQYPPGSFRSSDEPLELRVGPHSLQARGADGFHLALAGMVSLSVRPLSAGPAVERRSLSRALTGADHYQVLSATAYDVEGTLMLPVGNVRSAGTRAVAFRGRGYFDHHYGTAPFGHGLSRWIRARAVFGDEVRMFHSAAPAHGSRMPAEHHLSIANGSAVREAAVNEVVESGDVRAGWGLHRPGGIEVRVAGASDGLKLRNGRVLDSTPFSVRLTYDATAGAGRPGGRAVCDVVYPQRLRAPVLGRLMERSILRDDPKR